MWDSVSKNVQQWCIPDSDIEILNVLALFDITWKKRAYSSVRYIHWCYVPYSTPTTRKPTKNAMLQETRACLTLGMLLWLPGSQPYLHSGHKYNKSGARGSYNCLTAPLYMPLDLTMIHALWGDKSQICLAWVFIHECSLYKFSSLQLEDSLRSRSRELICLSVVFDNASI